LATAPLSTAADRIDWQTPIDRTRWFFCETLTPLYYTSVYNELEPEHRRRYNQLTGMLANEIIAVLETEFLDAALDAVESDPEQDTELLAAIRRFREDEERHRGMWHRLNRLSEPAWYAKRARHLVCRATLRSSRASLRTTLLPFRSCSGFSSFKKNGR
jgi:hypothetical protein